MENLTGCPSRAASNKKNKPQLNLLKSFCANNQNHKHIYMHILTFIGKNNSANRSKYIC